MKISTIFVQNLAYRIIRSKGVFSPINYIFEIMYKFSGKIKNFSLALMLVGILGIALSFFVADRAVRHYSHQHAETAKELVVENLHDEHSIHMIKNRPWAALYVALLFFFLLSLCSLAFYAIQQVAKVGWSVVLFRIMEAIAAYLPVGGILLMVFFVLSALHLNHLFVWMSPEVVASDDIIQAKIGYLNIPFFLTRSVIYILGWFLYQQNIRKLSLQQDSLNHHKNYLKIFKRSAAFLVFFLVTESMMSWDWIMSLDPHWFSTLFGWYVFASMIVTAITSIAMLTIYLKKQGYLVQVNSSHLHDLAKFMFGFSIFWTYLWFSQFVLIWYANIPEEVTYFKSRFNDYALPFLGMLVLNFVFPLLLLMNSDFKRISWFVTFTGIIILIGHYIDIYVMIMPATVGDHWFFGLPEIASLCFVFGLFLFTTFRALSKAPLQVKNNPFLKESLQHHS